MYLPPKKRFIRVRWWVVEINDFHEFLSLVVEQNLLNVGMDTAGDVQEDLGQAELSQQFQPLHYAQRGVVLIVEQRFTAHAHGWQEAVATTPTGTICY